MQKKTIAIISNNDMGLILASQLEKDGQHVILVDTDDSFSTQNITHRELPFFPDTVEARAAIVNLNSLFVDHLHYEVLSSEPLTFEDGQLKPFLGFGDNKNNTVSILSRYNAHSRLLLDQPLEAKMQKLREELKCKVLKFSELTRFEISGSEAQKLIINGNQDIFADHFVFNLSPNLLVPLISGDQITSRTRSRIAKTPAWARITLELIHNHPLMAPQHTLFLLSNQADGPFIVGLQADSPHAAASGTHSSIWECYIDNQFIEDTEYMSTIIKNMRKLIRRAYPQAETQTREVLTITPQAIADFNWLSEREEYMQPADNLTLFPPFNNHANGLPGCVIGASVLHEDLKELFRADQAPHEHPTVLENSTST